MGKEKPSLPVRGQALVALWHNSPEVMCVRWASEARALPSSRPHLEDVQNSSGEPLQFRVTAELPAPAHWMWWREGV